MPDGARAAEVGCKAMLELYRAEPKPLFDPLGFLHLALGRAHAAVVAIGSKLAVDLRPRATCAVCLVQRHEAYWAHIGDSRVYHLRAGAVLLAHARPQPRRAAPARRIDHARRRSGATRCAISWNAAWAVKPCFPR